MMVYIHVAAIIKFSYRHKRTKIGGLTDLANVVNTSANVNTTQLTGTPDGRVIVPTYDWQTFLYEHTKKLVGIRSFYHLRFSSTSKGHVFVRLKSDSPEVDYNLLKDKWLLTATVLPERLTLSGLNPARQWYLFQRIREFCPEEAKDVTCPMPSVPDTSTETSTPATSTPATSTTATATPSEPPLKKARLCGICREGGHNARSCPTNSSFYVCVDIACLVVAIFLTINLEGWLYYSCHGPIWPL